MKNNKGITLVVLVITIILLLIISGTSIIMGNVSIENYKDNVLESEARKVQSVVLVQYQKYITVNDMNILYGEACNKDGSLNSQGKYNLLKPNDLKKLGMRNPKDTYIVNYSTGEVINQTRPTYSNGEKVYLKGNDNKEE